MGELQLEALQREHRASAELEQDQAPSSSHARAASIASRPPSEPSPRLAHTLRRGAKRSEMSTVAMPPLEPSGGRGIPRLFDRDMEDPTAILQAPLAAALASRTAPGPARHTVESSFAVGTEPDRTNAMALPVPRFAAEPTVASEPKRPELRAPWHVQVLRPIALLIVFGAVCWLLRAML